MKRSDSFKRLRAMIEERLGGWLSTARLDDLTESLLGNGVLVPKLKFKQEIYQFDGERIIRGVVMGMSFYGPEVLYSVWFPSLQTSKRFNQKDISKTIFKSFNEAEYALKEASHESL